MDPSHGPQPHPACTTDIGGSSISARSLSYSVADSLVQISAQPGQKASDSMTTAVMHALIGTSKPHVSRHSHPMPVAGSQLSSFPSGHVNGPPYGALPSGSVHQPANGQILPHGAAHGHLHTPDPISACAMNFSSGQHGMMQTLAQHAAMAPSTGPVGIGLTASAIQAARVLFHNTCLVANLVVPIVLLHLP